MKSEMTIDEDGNKEWKLPNGEPHREDGAAIECYDGDKWWYINGIMYGKKAYKIEMIYRKFKKIVKMKSKMTVEDDDKFWKLPSGDLHREDGPAIECYDGDKQWWINGQLHREDGPAIEQESNGTKQWYIKGQLHRKDGPAEEYGRGTKCWWLNGEKHREDGPAIEWNNGDKEWYLNGVCHREDGAAIEYNDGTKEWWLNGGFYSIQYTEQGYRDEIRTRKLKKILG